MKVYVVINDGLHPTSSYYDIVEVCSSLKKATVVVETSVKDILANNMFDNPDVFCDKEIPAEWNNDKGCLIIDKDGWYEHFKIETYEVK